MKIYKILTAITLTIILISCGGSADNKEESHKKEEAHSDTNRNDKKKIEPTLSLNNGAKWAADEPTFNGMKAMRLAMTNFSTVHSDACSMKGPDHDQLHIVLAPMLGNVDVLKNGTDIYDARKNEDALEKHLEAFFKHFELK